MEFCSISIARAFAGAFVVAGSLLLAATSHAEWVTDPGTGCRAVNPNPRPNETIEWTGDCRDGLTQGLGAVIWYRDDKLNSFSVANFTDGKWG